jgi:hypothetical protein
MDLQAMIVAIYARVSTLDQSCESSFTNCASTLRSKAGKSFRNMWIPDSAGPLPAGPGSTSYSGMPASRSSRA